MKTTALLIIITMITGLFTLSCKKEQPPAENRSTSGVETPVVKVKHTDDVPLVNAVNNKDSDAVKKLLEQGVSANAKNKYGVPVLILAAYIGEGWITEMLLKAGADVNAVDRDGDTALHNAVYKMHLGVVFDLLNYGADINVKNKKGSTPMQIAVELKAKEPEWKIKELYETLLLVHSNSSELFDAVKRNDLSKVESLLKSGADPNTNYYQFSLELQSTNNKHMIKTPVLYYAIKKNFIDISMLLLQYNANPNFECSIGLSPPLRYYSTMTAAIKNKNVKMMKRLLVKGVSKKIASPGLAYAVSINDFELVKEFVNYGAFINYDGSLDFSPELGLNNTPLYYAIQQRNLLMIEYLLKKGANVSISVSIYPDATSSHSILSECISSNNIEVVELMLKHRPLSEFSIYQLRFTNVLKSAVMIAAEKSPKILKLFIAKGLDVNYKNEKSETAFHLACENNQIESVRILLKAGADINVKNSDGNTPLSIAKSKNYLEIVKLLTAAGARE